MKILKKKFSKIFYVVSKFDTHDQFLNFKIWLSPLNLFLEMPGGRPSITRPSSEVCRGIEVVDESKAMTILANIDEHGIASVGENISCCKAQLEFHKGSGINF